MKWTQLIFGINIIGKTDDIIYFFSTDFLKKRIFSITKNPFEDMLTRDPDLLDKFHRQKAKHISYFFTDKRSLAGFKQNN